MKANLLLLILIIGFNSSLVAQTSQVITDSVTINGRVTDYDNHPLDNVSVSWARPDFSEVSVTLTDKNGNYSIRIPKGKYHSMGALNMDEYIIANSTLPEKDQRLEFWGWDFIADRDTTLNGEKVPILMKQEIKEYFAPDEWGNAYLLTVDMPKNRNNTLPYYVFKVELTDLENGDRGEAIYYMEKETYVR